MRLVAREGEHRESKIELLLTFIKEFVMPTTLTLEIPDQIYRPLLKKADQRGKTLDQIILEWLGNIVKDDLDDPLLQLAGAYASDITDVGTKHDFYIGQELRNNHE